MCYLIPKVPSSAIYCVSLTHPHWVSHCPSPQLEGAQWPGVGTHTLEATFWTWHTAGSFSNPHNHSVPLFSHLENGMITEPPSQTWCRINGENA